VEGARPLVVDLLTVEEARQLLAGRLGESRVTAEPDAAGEIIQRCARLPLALSIIAARAALHPTFPLATFADQLRDARGRLDVLAGDEDAADVRAVFSWSYHALTPAAARLFRLLGLHPGPDIAAPAAASLAAVRQPQARTLLAELARANLLVEHIPGRYTFHDLLRAYTTDLARRLGTDEERHTATHRMLDHYLHTARAANALLNPARDPIALTPPSPGVIPEKSASQEQALAWFTTEHSALLAAVNHAAATGLDTHTWQLAWTLFTFLDRRGHWHDLAAIGHTAVAAAHRLADPTGQLLAHRILARAHLRLGRLDDAHNQLRHALNLFGQTGDQAGQADTHVDLARVWARQGSVAEVAHHGWQAHALHQATGHQLGQAQALNAIGWSHARLGDPQQALTCCRQALPLLQEFDDREGQAHAWGSLGLAHHHLGQHTQALACHRHALDLYRDLGVRYYEADTLTLLGDTHHATGNTDAACDAWQHALTILTDLHHPDAETVRTKLQQLNHS
jgi:tetratricopeptide (TPR) repeat protein